MRLHREADPAEDADEGGLRRSHASAAKPQREKRQIGERQHREEVLPLAELRTRSEGKHQDQERRGAEPVVKERRKATQERSRHPGTQDHEDRRRNVEREQGRQPQPTCKPRGQGGQEDDQRRVDINPIDVESLTVQDPLTEVNQPGHVVFGKRREEDQYADRHDDRRGNPPSS